LYSWNALSISSPLHSEKPPAISPSISTTKANARYGSRGSAAMVGVSPHACARASRSPPPSAAAPGAPAPGSDRAASESDRRSWLPPREAASRGSARLPHGVELHLELLLAVRAARAH